MSDLGIVRRMWSAMLGKSHGGERNLYEVLGYPHTLTADMFFGMYQRNDIAARIIRAFPQATWRHAPLVRDDAGATREESEFVRAWEDITDQHGLTSMFERLDLLSGLGEYAVLLVGMRDGLKLDEPYEPGDHELLYLHPYAQKNAQIASFDMDRTSPRYGLPLYYTLTTGSTSMNTPVQQRTERVHWSRIIHAAEYRDQDDVYGIPRLMPIYNRLLDLEKVVGGSAETFWLNANRGIAFEVDADADADEKERAKMKEQAEEFAHQIRRTMVLQGMKANVLGSDTASPKDNVEVLLQLIAGTAGIPVRILTGSERGELASSQDEGNWLARIDERRKQFASAQILKPFVELMILSGNLPEPKGRSRTNDGWWVEWDTLASMSEGERMEVAERVSNIIKNYLSVPGADLLVPEAEFRTRVLGWEAESEFMLAPVSDLDETDAEVTEQFDGGAAEETALNGAQINAIKEIAQAVADGMLPSETAINVILVGFPAVTEEMARRIIDPANDFTPERANVELTAMRKRERCH